MLGCAGLLTFSFHACIQRCTLFWWQYVLFLGTSQRTRSWHVWSCWWKGMPESMYMTSKWAYQTPVSSLIIWLAVLCLVKILVIALFFFCVCVFLWSMPLSWPIEVQKKQLGQYPAILTFCLVNKAYIILWKKLLNVGMRWAERCGIFY